MYYEVWCVVLSSEYCMEDEIIQEGLTEDDARMEAQLLNEEDRDGYYYTAKDCVSATGTAPPTKDGKPWYTHKDWRRIESYSN